MGGKSQIGVIVAPLVEWMRLGGCFDRFVSFPREDLKIRHRVEVCLTPLFARMKTGSHAMCTLTDVCVSEGRMPCIPDFTATVKFQLVV